MFCLIGLLSNHISVEVQISQWYVLFNRLIILSNQISVEIQITQWYVLLQGACVGMVAFPLQCGIDIVRVLLNYLALQVFSCKPDFYLTVMFYAWYMFTNLCFKGGGGVSWDHILTVAKILRKKKIQWIEIWNTVSCMYFCVICW